jgi:hypothetical protein
LESLKIESLAANDDFENLADQSEILFINRRQQGQTLVDSLEQFTFFAATLMSKKDCEIALLGGRACDRLVELVE